MFSLGFPTLLLLLIKVIDANTFFSSNRVPNRISKRDIS